MTGRGQSPDERPFHDLTDYHDLEGKPVPVVVPVVVPSSCGRPWSEHPSVSGEPYCEPSSCPATAGRVRSLRRWLLRPWRYPGSTGKSLACERHDCDSCSGRAALFRRCYDGCHNVTAPARRSPSSSAQAGG